MISLHISCFLPLIRFNCSFNEGDSSVCYFTLNISKTVRILLLYFISLYCEFICWWLINLTCTNNQCFLDGVFVSFLLHCSFILWRGMVNDVSAGEANAPAGHLPSCLARLKCARTWISVVVVVVVVVSWALSCSWLSVFVSGTASVHKDTGEHKNVIGSVVTLLYFYSDVF